MGYKVKVKHTLVLGNISTMSAAGAGWIVSRALKSGWVVYTDMVFALVVHTGLNWRHAGSSEVSLR